MQEIFGDTVWMRGDIPRGGARRIHSLPAIGTASCRTHAKTPGLTGGEDGSFGYNGSDRANALGLRALLTGAHREFHGLAFFEHAEARHVDVGVVNEDVLSVVGDGDETEALAGKGVTPMN